MEFNKRAFITEAETLALIRYTRASKGDVVEVGTFMAGTAENIAPHIPEGCALWPIDFFSSDGSSGFVKEKNPATLYHKYLVDFGNVFFVMGDSRKLGKYWGRDIGFLFIDGSHHTVNVLVDFDVWAPWVILGGVVSLHDSTGFKLGVTPKFRTLNGYNLIYEPGPERAVQDAVKSGEWEVIEEVDTITFLKRVERRS